MKLFSDLLDTGLPPYILLLISPLFYPYIVKGDIPYVEEDCPGAAEWVAAIEGILLSIVVVIILALPHLGVLYMKYGRFLLLVPLVYLLVGISFQAMYGGSYPQKITLSGVKAYIRKRYSWIFSNKR